MSHSCSGTLTFRIHHIAASDPRHSVVTEAQHAALRALVMTAAVSR